jgi:hypothetical protein
MPTATSFEREKNEVDAILGSGIFSRAPNLAHLLQYVCAKYFEGAAAEIKEYNIAVEALGRPAEFDQKRDSIVRVEAHRLRKRLREYYESDGAAHEIRIEIPSGQYTPRFVYQAGVAAPSGPVGNQSSEEASDDSEPPPPLVSQALVGVSPHPPVLKAENPKLRPPIARWFWVLSLFIVVVLGSSMVFIQRRGAVAPVPVSEPAVIDLSSDIRILAGVENGSYVDAFGRIWQNDRYYSGGSVGQALRLHPVLGTRDAHLYQARREGAFRYDIPLEPGSYILKLYFAEVVFGDNNVAGGGETSRIFDVNLNGQALLRGFDVINDGGSASADIKVFKGISPGADGKLHLEFVPETNPAFVNAIELVRSVPGKLPAIRIVARDRGIKDSLNRSWDPDRYAQGGQVVARPESNVASSEPELYRSERFGNLSYTIPVAQPGRYGVTMYFAENWFGPGNPGGGGVGSRVFDIQMNGVVVRRNFDILKEAGGVGHAVTVALHGVEPNHQGKIAITLTPARNYACINALEIVDESK